MAHAAEEDLDFDVVRFRIATLERERREWGCFGLGGVGFGRVHVRESSANAPRTQHCGAGKRRIPICAPRKTLAL
jgi:hypothetical protein